jgi:outer membrane biosynthesis protein TonB
VFVLAKLQQWDWRAALKSNPILRAFVISIVLHVMALLVVESGRKIGLWETRAVPKWVLDAARVTPPTMANSQTNEPSVLQFIEVDPAQATEEPKDAKLYSTDNTRAANPDTTLDTDRPKIDGTQKNVPKTRDTAKANAAPEPPPQPQAPPPKPQKRDTMQPNTKPVEQAEAEPPGDTKQNTLTPEEKAQRDLTLDRPPPPKPRARTLAQAREQKGIVEGQKMQQSGGVKRFAIEMDQDVKASPFGSYDAMFIAAVQSRWYQLLEQRNYVFDHSGKVVIVFRLYKDGRVMQMKVAENQVNNTLAEACQRAILDPAPYAPFPADLRRLLGADYREVRFTFHYN